MGLWNRAPFKCTMEVYNGSLTIMVPLRVPFKAPFTGCTEFYEGYIGVQGF